MTCEKNFSPPRTAGAATSVPPQPPRRSLDSRDLLAGDREVMIRHGDSTYRLRSTNKGKLILTK